MIGSAFPTCEHRIKLVLGHGCGGFLFFPENSEIFKLLLFRAFFLAYKVRVERSSYLFG